MANALPMTLRVYRRLSSVAVPLAPALIKRRLKQGKEDPARVGERRGMSADVRPHGPLVWIHGASVGEVLAAAALIILTAALCVLSTLMGRVFDRRRDFAIMKALGASDRLLNGFFAAEAAVIGATGALIGFILGIGIAAWIGRVNFHAPVVPRFSVLPFVLAGSIVVTLLSAILPISLLRRVQPATILRGE